MRQPSRDGVIVGSLDGVPAEGSVLLGFPPQAIFADPFGVKRREDNKPPICLRPNGAGGNSLGGNPRRSTPRTGCTDSAPPREDAVHPVRFRESALAQTPAKGGVLAGPGVRQVRRRGPLRQG